MVSSVTLAPVVINSACVVGAVVVGTTEVVVGTAEVVVGTAEVAVDTAEVVVDTAEVVVGTTEVVFVLLPDADVEDAEADWDSETETE